MLRRSKMCFNSLHIKKETPMPKATALMISLSLAISASARADEGAHWAYDGHGGPEHWAELSKDFCAASGAISRP